MRNLAGLLCLMMCMSEAAHAEPGAVPVPQIIVSGTGRVNVAPDEATLAIAVETHASSASAAAASNAKRMQAVREALLRAGLPDSAISTRDYMVQPHMRYEQGQAQQDGYDVANTLKLKTRELQWLGAYMDAALAAGATRIGGIEFSASKINNARRTALAQAIMQARGDAESMASAAGGRLGGLLELSASPAASEPMPFRATMAAQAKVETPVSPGEIPVEASVSARWGLLAGSVPDR